MNWLDNIQSWLYGGAQRNSRISPSAADPPEALGRNVHCRRVRDGARAHARSRDDRGDCAVRSCRSLGANGLMGLLDRTEHIRRQIGRGLEIVSAMAIVGFGSWLLAMR